MADDRDTILKRIIMSLAVHSDELQSIADEMEGDGDESEEAQTKFGNVTDAIVFIDTGREKRAGEADDPE